MNFPLDRWKLIQRRNSSALQNISEELASKIFDPEERVVVLWTGSDMSELFTGRHVGQRKNGDASPQSKANNRC